MEKMIYVYCLTKAGEMVKKGIYKNEIINAAKTGVEKFDEIASGFWDKLKEYIEKEKEIDRKWIPDTIENFGEDAALQTIEILRKELNAKDFIQSIFDVEKVGNPTIL